MPTITDNQFRWNIGQDWSCGGEEWSEPWGTSADQWAGFIYPRLFPFLHGSILEIAPGYGRWTEFLALNCSSLIGVDLSDGCVRACEKRFAGDPRLRFETNDGLTLPMISDRSVDFAFSFDSLVHAEADTMASYTKELARVLKPGAVAFLHHSNVADVRRSIWDKLKRRWSGLPVLTSQHWRATSMGASLMRGLASEAGMSCVQQEIVPWGSTGWPVLIDCMSTIVNAPGKECATFKNWRFREEVAATKRIGACRFTV
jgi:SAM-dependent methyltransferase